MFQFRRRFLLAGLAALGSFGTPSIATAAPLSQTFNANGITLHYLTEGTGEPVVLIHGLYSSAAMNWQMTGMMTALAKNHQVIALDLPGHGKSDKPDDESVYGVQMMEDVIRLMDHLHIRKAHIVGYSLGGMIALKLLAEHQDRALSGTLGGMGWLREGSMLQRVWGHMGRGRVAEMGQQGGTPRVCVTSIGKLAVTEAALKAIHVPVRIFVGSQDPVKQLYVAPLQTVRTDWSVVEIPGAGHISCVYQPSFISGVVDWVNKNR